MRQNYGIDNDFPGFWWSISPFSPVVLLFLLFYWIPEGSRIAAIFEGDSLPRQPRISPSHWFYLFRADVPAEKRALFGRDKRKGRKMISTTQERTAFSLFRDDFGMRIPSIFLYFILSFTRLPQFKDFRRRLRFGYPFEIFFFRSPLSLFEHFQD